MLTRNIKTIMAAGALFIGFTVSAADKVTYEDHVLPILRNNCLKCHNADKMKADLDISTYAALMNGSGNGDIVAAIQSRKLPWQIPSCPRALPPHAYIPGPGRGRGSPEGHELHCGHKSLQQQTVQGRASQ